MATKSKKVLYFIRGFAPTEANIKKASTFGDDTRVVYRNANAYRPGDALEQCDGVLGFPPEAYLNRFGKAVPAKSETATYTQADIDKAVEKARKEAVAAAEKSQASAEEAPAAEPAPTVTSEGKVVESEQQEVKQPTSTTKKSNKDSKE